MRALSKIYVIEKQVRRQNKTKKKEKTSVLFCKQFAPKSIGGCGIKL